MKSINIKGKDYIPVNERLKEFKKLYPTWKLIADIVEINDDMVIMKAEVFDESGVLMGRGYSQEYRSSSMINKTSMLENAETSAWGRALGNIGIGIDASIASADEVENAIKSQEIMARKVTESEVEMIRDKCKEANVEEGTVLKNYKIKELSDLTFQDFVSAMKKLNKNLEMMR